MDTTTDHFTPLALRVRGNKWAPHPPPPKVEGGLGGLISYLQKSQ